MFYVKFHKAEGRTIVAICDGDLLGKKFSANGMKLEISERFFNGERKSRKEVEDVLRNCDNLNLVGKNIIELAVSIGIVDRENVKFVDNVPHVLVVGL